MRDYQSKTDQKPVELEIIVNAGFSGYYNIFIHVFGTGGIDCEGKPLIWAMKGLVPLFTNTIGADKITDNDNGTYDFRTANGEELHSGTIGINSVQLPEGLPVTLKKEAVINIPKI